MSSPNTNVDGKRNDGTGAKRRFTLAGAAARVQRGASKLFMVLKPGRG